MIGETPEWMLWAMAGLMVFLMLLPLVVPRRLVPVATMSIFI
jgi:hypothetical protein